MTLNDIGDFLFRTFALSIRTVGDATDGESAVALIASGMYVLTASLMPRFSGTGIFLV